MAGVWQGLGLGEQGNMARTGLVAVVCEEVCVALAVSLRRQSVAGGKSCQPLVTWCGLIGWCSYACTLLCEGNCLVWAGQR